MYPRSSTRQPVEGDSRRFAASAVVSQGLNRTRDRTGLTGGSL